MEQLIILGLVKIVDNMIMTAKSITTYQNKKILTALLVIISQFIFYFVVKEVSNDSSILSIAVVSVCSGIGTYIMMFGSDKMTKDLTYTNIIDCKCDEDTEKLSKYLLENNIKIVPVASYNYKTNEPTKTIIAFASTRYESKLIDTFLEKSDTKYLRQVLH